MKKLIGYFLVFAILLSQIPVLAGEFSGQQTWPGDPVSVLPEDCIAGTVTEAADAVTIAAGDSAEWGFYLPYSSPSATVTYTGATEGTLTLTIDGADYTASVDGTGSAEIKFYSDSEEGQKNYYNMGAEEDSASMYFVRKRVIHRGEKEITLASTADISVSEIVFNKETAPGPNNTYVPNISDEEKTLITSVMMHEDAPAIVVGGGRRYVNTDDVSMKPYNLNGYLYLPIATLAKALGYYYEEIPEQGYALMRSETHEVVLLNGVCTVSEGLGTQSTVVKNAFIVYEGQILAAVRYFGELAGKTVGYKDGLVVIDNKYTVEDVLEKSTLTKYALAKFDGFIENEAQSGKTYYASPNGAADANGYITLAQAAAVAEPGDTVILKGGTYRTTLTPANSGSANAPITYKAAEGEKVVISALSDLGTPTAVAEHNFNTTETVYQVDANGIDLGLGRNQVFVTYNGETEVQTEARYPNGPQYLKDGRLSNLWGVEGNIYKSAGENAATQNEDGTTTYSYTEDVYNLIESDSLLNQEDDYWKGGIWVGQFGNAYAINSGKIAGSSKGKLVIDDTERTGRWWWNTWAESYNQSYHNYVESTTKKNVVSNHFNYGYITGHRNALDIAGEWIIEDDKAYIILPSDVTASEAKIEAKARQLVIDLSGKEYINIEGIDTIGGSVNMNGSKMCMLNDMDMKNITHFTLSADQKNGFIDVFPWSTAPDAGTGYLDQNGAPLRGEVGIFVSGSDNAIVNSTIDHSAGAGVYLNGTYTYLDNNVINDCGYGGAYYAGIHTDVFSWENINKARGGHGIYNNTVYNTGRACLDFNISENSPARAGAVFLPCEIAYNDFHDANITATDTGITYANGMTLGLDNKMSTMHHNYVYSTFAAEDKHPYMYGIYWDGNSHGCDTYDNIIFTTDDEAVFSAGHIVRQSYDGHEAAMRIWDNQALGYVEGGVDALDAHYFSEERPFWAGSTIGKAAYTKNLDKFKNGEYGISYKAADAEKSANVTIDSDGYAKITASGDYLVFNDVDFGTGASELSISYTGDSNWTYDEIEIRLDTADNDNVYKTTASVDSPDLNQTHTNRVAISATTGTHDVYVKVADYKSVRIGGIGVYDRSHAGKTDDFTQYMYASAYTDVYGTTTSFFTPELVQDGNNPAAPGVKNATPGRVIRYADRNISADSKYFVLAAGSRIGAADDLVINIYTADPDANPEFADYIGGNPATAVNLGYAKKVGTTRVLNTEYYELDPIVTELDEPGLAAGTYDIYIEFTGTGSANIEYFGFLKSDADLANYRTQMRQWTGWTSAHTESSNTDKPLYWLSDVSEDHTYIANTFSGASLTYNNVKAVSDCANLRICYAAEADSAGQPITVTVKNSSGTTVATGTLITAGTDGEFVTQEIELSATVTGTISSPSVYTVTLGFGGSGNQTCQVKWFEFAE